MVTIFIVDGATLQTSHISVAPKFYMRRVSYNDQRLWYNFDAIPIETFHYRLLRLGFKAVVLYLKRERLCFNFVEE